MRSRRKFDKVNAPFLDIIKESRDSMRDDMKDKKIKNKNNEI